MAGNVIPEVADEEVLGRGRSGPSRGWSLWVPWVVIGLLLLALVWGLLVIVP